MDNDSKIVKTGKIFIKNLRFNIEYAGKKIYSEEDGNALIGELLRKDLPFAIVRLGSSETNCAYPWMKGIEPSQEVLERGLFAAGIFPPDATHNSEFSQIYLEAVSEADVMALCDVYKEKEVVNTYCRKDVKYIRTRSIEPYYFDNPWSQMLENKKLLVVHPFADTIKRQFEKRAKIFDSEKKIWPENLELKTVKAVQSNAGGLTAFESWRMALDYMESEIGKVDFDVAIIGAGAYALPLTVYCKSIGKMAIQMSGATQIMFGIKGKRWDTHPVISAFYNEYWVRPSVEETPPQIEKVEGGSYW